MPYPRAPPRHHAQHRRASGTPAAALPLQYLDLGAQAPPPASWLPAAMLSIAQRIPTILLDLLRVSVLPWWMFFPVPRSKSAAHPPIRPHRGHRATHRFAPARWRLDQALQLRSERIQAEHAASPRRERDALPAEHRRDTHKDWH